MTALPVGAKMTPNAKSQKIAAATSRFAKFLIATLIEFFVRTSPLSRAVKPACMNRTSAADVRSQTRSTGSALSIALAA